MAKQMDEKVAQLMKQAPQGVNPYYWAIGTLGGQAVREKYGNGNTQR